MKLLDSMYKNIYMPPVLFSVYTDRDGTEVRRCVDGKQRLSSITGFFDGQVRKALPLTFCSCLIRFLADTLYVQILTTLHTLRTLTSLRRQRSSYKEAVLVPEARDEDDEEGGTREV